MITLTIGNSYSKISGLSASQEKELRKILSYKVGSHFSGFGIQTKSLLSKKGEFPTGLLHRVPPWVMQFTDKRTKVTWRSRVFDATKCYDWQLKALVAASTYRGGTISAPTGTGKSRVISMICTASNARVLVVVPSLEIKKQLSETLSSLKYVRVENIDNPDLKNLSDFDILIIDEAHHVAAKTYHKLNKTTWVNIGIRFCLTATPFRNDTEETLLFESIAGQIIYKLDFKTAVREKYIVPIEAYYLESPKRSTNAFSYREVYNELVVNNTNKNVMIAQALRDIVNAGKSIMCLVKEVAHGNILSEITDLSFITGADDESHKYIELFNKGNILGVIATTGIMGEGIDSKACEYVIIAGGGKAKSQFMQQVGRVVRNYPGKESAKIILIRDKSHKYLLRHYNEQKKILLDEYGVIPVKLVL